MKNKKIDPKVSKAQLALKMTSGKVIFFIWAFQGECKAFEKDTRIASNRLEI